MGYFIAQSEDHRSETQLHHDATSLLKGCLYHFQKNVFRIARITSIVSPESRSSFKSLCDLLTTAETGSEFDQAVAKLQKQWPQATRWLNWWLAPDHARMIFPSQRTMPEALASRLPSTTHAEEAMHATIYHIVGSLHNPLFKGLDRLLNVEKGF